MTKQFLILLLILGFTTSSNAQKMSTCDCLTMQLKAIKEYEEVKHSIEKLAELKEKYRDKTEKCQKIIREFKATMSGLSAEEKSNRKEKFRKDCPAFDEIEKIKIEKYKIPFFFLGVKPGMNQEEIEALGLKTKQVAKKMNFGDLSVETLVLEIRDSENELIAEAYNEPGTAIKTRGFEELNVLTEKEINYKGVKIGTTLEYFIKCYPKNAKITWNSVGKKAFITTEYMKGYRFYFSPEAFTGKIDTKSTDYKNFENEVNPKFVDLKTTINEIRVSSGF